MSLGGNVVVWIDMVLDPCMPVECVRCRDPALRDIVCLTIPARVTNWKTQRGLQGGVVNVAGQRTLFVSRM